MTIASGLIAELRGRLSAGSVVAEASELPAYGLDFTGPQGVPGVVVRAQQVEDVVATMRFASRHGIAVVPRAAGTNVSGGYVPTAERIMLDLRPLNRILHLDANRREIVVEPGVLNGEVNARAVEVGLHYIPDPGSAAISSIGGNIAENAGGMHCLKSGVTVHHVAAVSGVLANGDQMRFAAEDSGPDLLGVIVGSEGTLAIVTEATLALQPLPLRTRTLLAVFDHAEEAAEAVSTLIARGVIPAALEFVDRRAALLIEAYAPAGYPTDADALLLVNLEGDPDEVQADLGVTEAILRRQAREVRRADDDPTREALWRGRAAFALALAATGRGWCICDTTVPRERIPAMQRAVRGIASRYGLEISMLGHAGDGNVHPIILFDAEDRAQLAATRRADDAITLAALSLGGTITGEHGVGRLKRHHMTKRFTPAAIAAMRAVKRAFDPAGLLNPGVLLPDPAADEPALPIFQSRIRTAVDARRPGSSQPTTAPTETSIAPVTAAPNAEISLDPANLTVNASPEVSLAALRQALTERGYRCAVTPAEASGSLGEALNQASQRAAIRDSLLAVEATLPEGLPVRFGSNAVKDVAGLDLKRLYLGSGRAFGTPRQLVLRVTPMCSTGS